MAMNVSRSKGAIAEINVTPMADVMIVLLIIFMVMTPLIANPSLPLPRAAHGEEKKGDAALEILLTQDGQLSLAGREMGPFEPALGEVTAQAQADPRRPVWVKADRDVPYDWIAAILDAARRGGIEDVHLATTLPEVEG